LKIGFNSVFATLSVKIYNTLFNVTFKQSELRNLNK